MAPKHKPSRQFQSGVIRFHLVSGDPNLTPSGYQFTYGDHIRLAIHLKGQDTCDVVGRSAMLQAH